MKYNEIEMFRMFIADIFKGDNKCMCVSVHCQYTDKKGIIEMCEFWHLDLSVIYTKPLECAKTFTLLFSRYAPQHKQTER